MTTGQMCAVLQDKLCPSSQVHMHSYRSTLACFSSLFLRYELQGLVSQAVQIFDFLAIDAGRALYQQGRCRHKQCELSLWQSTLYRTSAAVSTLSKVEVRASLKRKGNTFQHVLRTHWPIFAK